MISFTLLDDSTATTDQPRSRLYTDFEQELCCADVAQFDAFTQQIEAALRRGLYAIGVFSYELGVELAGLQPQDNGRQMPSRVLLYRRCAQLSAAAVADWLAGQPEADGAAGIAALRPGIDAPTFVEAIHRIQDYIAAGDTYQVNYTFRFHFTSYGSIQALYRRLRDRQAVPYGALIAMPDGSALLSLSPELFVRHQQGQLYARPMKGTAEAFSSADDAEATYQNALLGQHLATDVKNRAENVMIVDLLRNDLGRIARLGTVRVPELFDVRRFGSVLQMTSSVSAELREGVSLAEVLRAIYPCGSITGAPKHRTMQIINELESEPRGIYTGAIGWFDPLPDEADASQSVPDFCLSVPIRTLHLQPPGEDGLRDGMMGVGAGIVFDSVADDEYQESLLKARFLTGLPPQFSLFETMHATRADGCRNLSLHMARLETSARYFGFRCDAREIATQLHLHCAQLPAELPYRVRLSLDGAGQISIVSAVLQPLNLPVKLLLADQTVQSQDLWLRHKTTIRERYDRAWQQAESVGAFDMLFFNEAGLLTEGGRSNVLVEIEGRWLTPPLAAGILPGVMRTRLLADPAWDITERHISRSELLSATQIMVCNALRGIIPAQLA